MLLPLRETVLRVVEESVLVAGVSSGGILAEELSLPEDVLGRTVSGSRFTVAEVSAKVTVSTGSVGGGGVGVSGVNTGALDVNSEGVAGEGGISVEEIAEGSNSHTGVLGGNLRDNDGGVGVASLEGISISLVVVGNLGAVSSGLGSTDEGADVGVVALGEDLLAG